MLTCGPVTPQARKQRAIYWDTSASKQVQQNVPKPRRAGEELRPPLPPWFPDSSREGPGVSAHTSLVAKCCAQHFSPCHLRSFPPHAPAPLASLLCQGAACLPIPAPSFWQEFSLRRDWPDLARQARAGYGFLLEDPRRWAEGRGQVSLVHGWLTT